MIIEDDREIFKFSRKLGEIEDSACGSTFLCYYWQKSGKLRLLTALLKGRDINADFREIAYVVASQNCCERLGDALDNLMKEPYTVSKSAPIETDADTESLMNGLISEMRKTGKLDIRAGWQNFYEMLCGITASVAAYVNTLIGSGKPFRFCSNADSLDVLRGDVNFTDRRGRYFIADILR